MRSTVFLLSCMSCILRVEGALTFRVSSFTNFRFQGRNMNRLCGITIFFTISGTRHVRVQILTRMFRFNLFVINICHCMSYACLHTNVWWNGPIQCIYYPSSSINASFRSSNGRSFHRVICPLIRLLPNRTRITIKMCGVFFIQYYFNPVFGPLSRYSFM